MSVIQKNLLNFENILIFPKFNFSNYQTQKFNEIFFYFSLAFLLNCLEELMLGCLGIQRKDLMEYLRGRLILGLFSRTHLSVLLLPSFNDRQKPIDEVEAKSRSSSKSKFLFFF